MNETLENLWNEYFAEKCAEIDSEKEKTLIKKIDELHKKVKESLTQEQNDALEKYVEALYENQGLFVKKAFFKGCGFISSIFFEACNTRKA